MNDIIIDGVSINELRKAKDALLQGANKFIAESIAKAQEIVKERLVVAASYGEAEAAAQEALTLLENAQLVSGTSGVVFYLPFYEEYGQYDSNDILSQIIENADHDVIGKYYGGSTLSKLHSLLEDMESTARDWHSSRC